MDGSDRSTRFLHDWWQRKRGTRAMPARSELDPVELKPILRDVIVIAVEQSGAGSHPNFAYRLVGTEIDERLGIHLTGITLDKAPIDGAKAAIQEQYETAVRERRPVFCTHNVVVNQERYVEYDRLVVPLSGDREDTVTTLIAALDFRCAYRVEFGRPDNCERPQYCDRIDLCLAPRTTERKE